MMTIKHIDSSKYLLKITIWLMIYLLYNLQSIKSKPMSSKRSTLNDHRNHRDHRSRPATATLPTTKNVQMIHRIETIHNNNTTATHTENRAKLQAIRQLKVLNPRLNRSKNMSTVDNVIVHLNDHTTRKMQTITNTKTIDLKRSH